MKTLHLSTAMLLILNVQTSAKALDDWIDNAPRFSKTGTPLAKLTEKPTIIDLGEKQLPEIDCKTFKLYIPDKDPIYEHRKDLRGQSVGSFELKTYASVASTNENGKIYDYYHIVQAGIFKPDEILWKGFHIDKNSHPIFVSQYEMSAQLDKAMRDKASIIANTPPTAENATQLTHTVTVTLSGTFGLSEAPNGLTATQQTGINLTKSHARTVSIKDVGIENHVDPALKNMRWIYKVNNLSRKEEKSSAVSHATFQPSNQWVWRIERDPREDKISFTNRLAVQLTMFNDDWYNCSLGHHSGSRSGPYQVWPALGGYDQEGCDGKITIKVPPLPKGPSEALFTATSK